MTIDADLTRKAMLDSINRLAEDMREMRTDMKKELGELRQISERLVKIETRLEDIQELKTENLAIKAELALLKADLNKRDGERGMLATILKSPLSYLIAAGAGLIAWIKGGV